MDERIISLLEEQNQLLKRYLWRLRFSLLGLLLMTTATAIGLGVLVYKPQSKKMPAIIFTTRKAMGTNSDGNIVYLEQKVSEAGAIIEQSEIKQD